MRRLLPAVLAIVLGCLVATGAQAQSGAYCPIASATPRIISTASYVLKLSDQCGVLIFTNSAVAQVTAPAPNTFPPGFQVILISPNTQAGGIQVNVVSPAAVNGVTGGSYSVSPLGSVTLMGDGTNFWSNAGSNGVSSAPAQNFTTSFGVFSLPGNAVPTSNVLQLPQNAVIQINNPASWPASQDYWFATCRFAPNMPSQATYKVPPTWLYVQDYLGRGRYIPAC